MMARRVLVTRGGGFIGAHLLDLSLMLLLLAGSVAYLCAVPRPLGLLDEGLFLYEAKRILHGEVFYRDIFDIVTPGAFYLLALVFALFGATMTVARTTAAVVHGLIAVLVYLTGRRLGVRRSLSVATAASQLAVCEAAWPYASAHWIGTLVTMLLLLVLVRRPGVARSRWFVRPGILLGVLTLIQHQKAVILALGVATLCAVDFLIERRRGAPLRLRTLASSTLALAGGVLLVVIPSFAAVLASAGIEPVFVALVVHPIFNYHNVGNRIVWGDVNVMTLRYARRTFPNVLIYLPVVLLPALALALWSWLRRTDPERLAVLSLLVVFCIFSVGSIAYHPDFIHLAFIAQPFFLLAAVQAEWALDRLRRPAWLAPLLGAAVALSLLATFAAKLEANLARSRRAFSYEADTAFGRVDFRNERETRVITAVRSRLEASPTRSMFVYPGPPALYLLTGAENPTRYQIVGMPYLRRDQIDEILRDLERKQVPYIFMPRISQVDDPVVNFAKEKYRRVDLKGFDFYVRKGMPDAE